MKSNFSKCIIVIKIWVLVTEKINTLHVPRLRVRICLLIFALGRTTARLMTLLTLSPWMDGSFEIKKLVSRFPLSGHTAMV